MKIIEGNPFLLVEKNPKNMLLIILVSKLRSLRFATRNLKAVTINIMCIKKGLELDWIGKQPEFFI